MFKTVILIMFLLAVGIIFFRLLAKILGLTLSASKIFIIILGVLAGIFFLILQKVIPFLAKHLSTAATWIIAAIVTGGLLIYAAGRKIFCGESISDFIKKLIPHKEFSRRTDFSLLLIELADSIQADIFSKLKTQYEKIFSFFKPIDGEQKN